MSEGPPVLGVAIVMAAVSLIWFGLGIVVGLWLGAN